MGLVTTAVFAGIMVLFPMATVAMVLWGAVQDGRMQAQANSGH